MAVVIIPVILEPKKLKSVTVSIFPPSIFHEVIGLDTMVLIFWMLSFKRAFPLSSLTLIKKLFSSSSLPAIRVVSSAYLRLLIFLPAVLIPDWDSSSSLYLNLSPQCVMVNRSKLFQSQDLSGTCFIFSLLVLEQLKNFLNTRTLQCVTFQALVLRGTTNFISAVTWNHLM